MVRVGDPAPELDVDGWIGTPTPLGSLRGRVILVEAFQMLCAGCLYRGLPQAQRVRRLFPDVAVLGLHTVFEHHEVTGRDALEVFVAELRLPFPVAIDRHDEGPIPVTMRTYGLQGTPSTLVVDRAGRLRGSHLGTLEDLELGSLLGALRAEESPGAGAEVRPGESAESGLGEI